MTEAQKYEGALYKAKPAKPQKSKPNKTNLNNGNSKPISSSIVPRNPYVEDVPDVDDPHSTHLPPAPSPPPATPAASKDLVKNPSANVPDKDDNNNNNNNLNVFDYLVPGDNPNASKASLVGGSKEPMAMVDHAPPIFDAPRQLARLDDNHSDDEAIYDLAYEENGFSYGTGPIPPPSLPSQPSNVSTEFTTPAPRVRRERVHQDRQPSPEYGSTTSQAPSDKKRKRGYVDESRLENDTPMADAPSSAVVPAPTPSLKHSGLTGGLDRMMREYSYSPEYPDYRSDRDYEDDPRHQDPVSPIKRSKRDDKESHANDNGLGISIKGRAGRIMSLLGGTGITTSSSDPTARALVRTRRRSSDGQDSNSRKQTKKTRTRQADAQALVPSSSKSKRRTFYDGEDTRPRRLKAIDYHRDSDSENRSRSPREKSRLAVPPPAPMAPAAVDDTNQLIVYRNGEYEDPVYREKATHFLSLVTKGPESERGCSVHKALKRYHRDNPSSRGSEDRDVSAAGVGAGSNNGSERKNRDRGRERIIVDRERVKGEEEKDLWKTLRLKRNERGEVVVFL